MTFGTWGNDLIHALGTLSSMGQRKKNAWAVSRQHHGLRRNTQSATQRMAKDTSGRVGEWERELLYATTPGSSPQNHRHSVPLVPGRVPTIFQETYLAWRSYPSCYVRGTVKHATPPYTADVERNPKPPANNPDVKINRSCSHVVIIYRDNQSQQGAS